MASNPFFSGRIPLELYQQAERYCLETGKAKTELLIEALSAYLNFPVTSPGKHFANPIPEISKEMFEALEIRIEFLEKLLKIDENFVINNDNNNQTRILEKIDADNLPVVNDNRSDNEDKEKVVQSVIALDNNDNIIIETKIDDPKSEVLETTTELSKFEEIITAEVVKKTNLTRNQIKWLMDGAIEKVKQQGKIIEAGKLLKEPIEVFHKSDIKIDDNSYKLFYAGENSKERPIWNLIPDNSNYQGVFIKLNSPLKPIKDYDNVSYQNDNEKNIMEEKIGLTVPEMVEKDADEQT